MFIIELVTLCDKNIDNDNDNDNDNERDSDVL